MLVGIPIYLELLSMLKTVTPGCKENLQFERIMIAIGL
jgi:hypothetical protein